MDVLSLKSIIKNYTRKTILIGRQPNAYIITKYILFSYYTYFAIINSIVIYFNIIYYICLNNTVETSVLFDHELLTEI